MSTYGSFKAVELVYLSTRGRQVLRYGIVSLMSTTETVVVSVGGSLIVPDAIDATFLKRFKRFVLLQIENGKRFVIITGGGKTARRYQDVARKVSKLTADDLDWLGVHATRLNGHLLRTIFRDIAHPVIITNPDDVLDVPKKAKLVVAAGYRPGASTDLRAVQIAMHLGARRLINLSNIDYAYTKDPNTHKDAERIKEADWPSFRALLPPQWDPGLSSPFDPVAAQEAERAHIEVVIINGKRLGQVERYLKGDSFIGTRIR